MAAGSPKSGLSQSKLAGSHELTDRLCLRAARLRRLSLRPSAHLRTFSTWTASRLAKLSAALCLTTISHRFQSAKLAELAVLEGEKLVTEHSHIGRSMPLFPVRKAGRIS